MCCETSLLLPFCAKVSWSTAIYYLAAPLYWAGNSTSSINGDFYLSPEQSRPPGATSRISPCCRENGRDTRSFPGRLWRVPWTFRSLCMNFMLKITFKKGLFYYILEVFRKDLQWKCNWWFFKVCISFLERGHNKKNPSCWPVQWNGPSRKDFWAHGEMLVIVL